ncbi:MAG: hypothetical protein AAB629_00645 [Patescibacteria group bacterium]
MKLFKSQKGYTLLFAVLTASLVLGVAAFTVGVARKQHILISTARDSIFSFYNADSAISCIVASWNNATNTSPGSNNPTSPSASVSCNGGSLSTDNFFESISSDDWPTVNAFKPNSVVYRSTNNSISFDSNGGCAKFEIWVGYDSDDKQKSIIEARGYNVCDSSGEPSASSRTVERAIRITQ